MNTSIVPDKKIRDMSGGEARAELFRIRQEILFHKTHRNDKRLYEAVLPEGSKGMGFMTSPAERLKKNCGLYFRDHPEALRRFVKRGNFDPFLTGGDAKIEIRRTRRLMRTHKGKKDNGRCWLNDEVLYQATIPEGSDFLGADLSSEALLAQCDIYIRREKARLALRAQSRR